MYYKKGFPSGSDSKASACNAGDLGSVPQLGRSPGEGKGYPVQCSGLENSVACTELNTNEQLPLSPVGDFWSYSLDWVISLFGLQVQRLHPSIAQSIMQGP